MIRNEREYRITRAQAAKFERAIAETVSHPHESSDSHPLLWQAQIDGMKSLLDELREELAEYDALRAGTRRTLEAESFDTLPRALIQARIAIGLSQRDLAERLGMKEQQIQRYEANEYASASMSRVQEVIHALGVEVREQIILPRRDQDMPQSA